MKSLSQHLSSPSPNAFVTPRSTRTISLRHSLLLQSLRRSVTLLWCCSLQYQLGLPRHQIRPRHPHLSPFLPLHSICSDLLQATWTRSCQIMLGLGIQTLICSWGVEEASGLGMMTRRREGWLLSTKTGTTLSLRLAQLRPAQRRDQCTRERMSIGP
jgi:hypothetical protein